MFRVATVYKKPPKSPRSPQPLSFWIFFFSLPDRSVIALNRSVAYHEKPPPKNAGLWDAQFHKTKIKENFHFWLLILTPSPFSPTYLLHVIQSVESI